MNEVNPWIEFNELKLQVNSLVKDFLRLVDYYYPPEEEDLPTVYKSGDIRFSRGKSLRNFLKEDLDKVVPEEPELLHNSWKVFQEDIKAFKKKMINHIEFVENPEVKGWLKISYGDFFNYIR